MTEMVAYAGQGIYALFAAVAGMCAAPFEPPVTQRELIRKCHRDILKAVRELNRQIVKQKNAQASLKSQIRALHAKNAQRDVMAKAYELRFAQVHLTKLHKYAAQLQGVSNELRMMSAQMTRANAIVDTTNLMRVMSAVQPPVECMHVMREFAKQMQTAGLVDASVEEMFSGAEEETDETSDIEINALIREVVAKKPRKEVVVEPIRDDDDVPLTEESEDPEPQEMRQRIEALRA